MRFWKSDAFLAGAVSALALFLSFLLYRDFQARIDAGSRQLVGHITFKERVAQRKYQGQVIWEDLEQKSPLYSNDTIRTEDLSEAKITLLDETVLSLEEKSMIVLATAGDGLNINFEYGGIQAAQGKNSNLTIQAGDKKVALSDSDVRLSGKSGEELSMVVNRGSAEVQSGGKTESIGENQKASLKGEEVKVERLSLIPVSPADGALLSTAGRLPVNFSWQSGGAATLEVADTGGGVVATANGASGATVNLGAGSYTWRIRAQNPQSRAMEFSPARRLTIQSDEPLVLVSPANGSTFPFTDEPPPVSFVWRPAPNATNYTLEIGRSAGLGDAETRAGASTRLSVNLSEGRYYWRVGYRNPLTGSEVKSAVASFTVSKRDKAAAPSPARPSEGAQLPDQTVQKGLLFTWRADRDIAQTTLEVAADPGFGNIISSLNTSEQVASVRIGNGPGRYYWRLRGRTTGGEATDISAVRSFIVQPAGKIELVAPYPGAEVDGGNARQGLVFSWRSNPGAHKIEITDENGSTRSLISRNGTAQVKLKPGAYSWKVSQSGDLGEVLAESEVGRFRVRPGAIDVRVIEPEADEVIDISKEDEIIFRWQMVDDIRNYRIRLYLEDNEMVLNVLAQGNQYRLRDFKDLKPGKVRFTITALEGDAAEEGRSHYFIIEARSELKAPVIISPEVQFTE